MIKKLLRRLIEWAFSDELSEIRVDRQRMKNILGNMDVSVDVHHYSPSWAVISIQGESTDYIKFMSLGKQDLMEIRKFLSRYERAKIDCSPFDRQFLFEDKFYKGKKKEEHYDYSRRSTEDL